MTVVVRHFARAIVAREIAIWVLARALVVYAGAYAAENLGLAAPDHPLRLHPLAALVLVAAVALGGYGWMVRNHEHRFLALVGYPRAALLALLAGPPLALELATAVMVRL